MTSREPRGVIVGAGTSSGKTLAFYIPAFAAIAEQARPGSAHVHTLAIYPRRELLRDQLREAVLSASRVGDVLTGSGRRAVRIGALYGDTPSNPNALGQYGKPGPGGWLRRSDGFICPYLTCPHCDGQ